MRVATLGQLGAPGVSALDPADHDLPSSHSVKSALRGDPSGWFKVLGSTLLRSLLVAPGVWAGGARGGKLIGGSLIASLSITSFLFIWYGAQEAGLRMQAPAVPTVSTPTLPNTAIPAPGAGTGFLHIR